jgi:arginine utilization protein RocB
MALDDPSHVSGTRVVDCLAISERWTFGVKEEDGEEAADEGNGMQGRGSSNLQEGTQINDISVGQNDAHSDQATTGNRRFNVLVAEEVRSDGVYERRGVGWVYSRAITRSLLPGVAWKRIVLA